MTSKTKRESNGSVRNLQSRAQEMSMGDVVRYQAECLSDCLDSYFLEQMFKFSYV